MFTSLSPGALGFSVPLDEGLRLAADNGFGGLDLPLTELLERVERTSVEEVKDLFDAAKVRPGGWGLPVNFRGDEDTYRAGLAALPRYAALAGALGSPWCSTWILPYSDDRDYEANMEHHVERLRPIAQVLADDGCRFGLEFVGPKTMRAGHRHEFIHSIDGALELGRRLGTGNVGLLLDCFHWYTAHGTAEDLARLSAEQVVYVHVNDARPERGVDEQIDNQRLLPGAGGVIDIVGFLRALERMGYDGPVAVEPFDATLQEQPPAERARLAAQSLSRVWVLAGLG